MRKDIQRCCRKPSLEKGLELRENLVRVVYSQDNPDPSLNYEEGATTIESII